MRVAARAAHVPARFERDGDGRAVPAIPARLDSGPARLAALPAYPIRLRSAP